LPPSTFDVSASEVLLLFGGVSFFEVELVLIFWSSLAIVFPNADLSDHFARELSGFSPPDWDRQRSGAAV